MILPLIVCLALQSDSIEEMLSLPINAQHKRYDAKDSNGVKLDCLVAEQAGNRQYLGVHHAVINGVFHLRLVESSDLLNWKPVRPLDDHAHQGTLRRFGSKWLLAWEKDGPNGNWIRLAAFDSIDALRKGTIAKQIDLPRHHSQSAEGTPSILDLKGDRWETSTIQLRFHFWRDRVVDRQAEGTLANFKDWKSSVRKSVNDPLEDKYRGNIGDRTQFTVGKDTFEVLEAQYRKDDWASWRILLSRNGSSFRELAIKTEKDSRSFANPAVTVLTLPNGKPGIFVTYFMPSQGNAEVESGELIYW